ncbi:MAG: T9SS type A sorting domain-containing protein, partial [Bacteroidia bacterium]
LICEDDAAFVLSGESPAGGTWSGPGVIVSQFSPTGAGAGTHIITYTFTDFNGCTGVATDTIVVQECTGIADVSAGVLELYPNPAANEFLFVSSGNGMLEIVSASGRLVASRRITSTRETVNTSEMASGIYMVRYTTASGASSTARLVIQR